jgi:signal transduction histidine kinase
LVVTILRAAVAARTWRDYLYLAVSAPIALGALVTLVVAVWLGALLSLTIVGIPLLAGIVLGAREYGALPRLLVRVLLGEAVEAPRRRQPRARGFLPWLRASLGDIDGWRAIAYIVVACPVSLVGAYLVAAALVGAGVLVSYPVAWQVIRPTQTGPDGVVHHSMMQFGEFYVETWPRALATCGVGLAVLVVVPWVARLFTTVDRALVRGLLGPSRLSERVDTLEASRAHAVDDSAATLRRIERDLHDGTQARLVALAMHLDMAKDKLAASGIPGGGADIDRARDLLDQAHRNATDAITELRDVTRSIHPPALDRGLDEALTTLAARSGVPASVRTHLPTRPSPAIETIAYYCVAELLTNVAKHSGAAHAAVTVDDVGGVLHLQVTDDGRGGAHVAPGGGLAGLVERIRTVDGRLALASPSGGPTVATVELPLGV